MLSNLLTLTVHIAIPEHRLPYRWLDPKEQTSMKHEPKYTILIQNNVFIFCKVSTILFGSQAMCKVDKEWL